MTKAQVVRRLLIAFAAGAVIAAIVVGLVSIVRDDDSLSLTVTPSEARAGELVTLTISDTAQDRDANPGLTFLQGQSPGGKWRTTYWLGAEILASNELEGQPARSIEKPRGPTMFLGPLPGAEELEDETVRIPQVAPGSYRLAKVIEPDRSPEVGGQNGLLSTPITVVAAD